MQNYTLTSSKLLDKLRESVETTLANGDKTRCILKIIRIRKPPTSRGSGAPEASDEDIEN